MKKKVPQNMADNFTLIEEIPDEEWQKTFAINIHAMFYLSKAAMKHMEKGGSIINMSSQMGHVGGANRTVYCATKHAMEGFTKAMAIELAPYSIRVNAVCPGLIRTDLPLESGFDEAAMREYLAKIPLRRLGAPVAGNGHQEPSRRAEPLTDDL